MNKIISTEKPEIHFQSDHLSMEYIPDSHYAIFTWKGHLDLIDYEKALEVMLDFVRRKRISRCIADTTHLHTIPARAQKFIDTIFMPQIEIAGITKMSVIVSVTVYNSLIIKKIMAGKSIETHYFDTLDEGKKWLLD